ncbi:hypothetical protein HHL17_12165 [Chitinophaga sp. G-6-1-13]|uniref:Uncharacterized protein n=1 Tax=Chitinophaga fulva TaxID=2728842 RepID=A0A848GMP9_9BACT|nr:hypothetical protein [Chitinophaga fulva]NML37950.1 hypothetical protein [Chitinophaga fulva]
MGVNYLVLLFTSLYLAGTFLYYKYAKKKGIEFRYKPFYLLAVIVLFLFSLYGIIVGKQFF